MSELPTRRLEAWRWADLRHAEALMAVPAPANDAMPDLEALALPVPAVRAVIAGGRVVDAAGRPAHPAPDRSLAPHPLADIAAAEARAGLVIEVGKGEDGGLMECIHLGTAGAAHSVLRVELAAGARLTLVETVADAETDHWSNIRLDARLAEGAVLERVLRVETGHGLASTRAHVSLGPSARLVDISFVASPAAVRTETHVRLEGEGAHARVNGVLLAGGAAALDSVTRLHHAVPHTASRQTWRLLATDTGQASIAGGVAVARLAQKTDAQQSLRGLLLKRTGAVNLKPELEILADDVACAHGCTVGEIDPLQRFYLESRGVPRAEAQAVLMQAFAAEALDALADPRLHEPLSAALARRLEALA
jgi:Fe-S cluster assembly protein SufD